MEQQHEYWKQREVADFLGVPLDVIHRYVASGRIKSHDAGNGNARRIHRSEVERLAALLGAARG